MTWLLSLLSGLSTLAKWAFAWWSDRKAQQHDAVVREAQQAQDALKGNEDALRQVDRVGDALDAPDGGVRDDPYNRNR